MKTRTTVCSAALVLAACGCSTPQSITRSQSPHHGQVSVVPSSYGNLATTQHGIIDSHTYSSSYHSTSGFPGYDAYLPGPPGACGHGPCGHGACGLGCGHGCGCGHTCPQHYHSYAYSRPHDLVYPPAGAPGGAVVYPYYTHKGPSDFFRDDPKHRSRY